MSTLKRALATAAVVAVPTLAATPAEAGLLFDNTNTVGENPEYTGVTGNNPEGEGFVQPTAYLLTLPNPTEPHGGLRLTFHAAATGPGAVQVSMMQIGSLGVETSCDQDGNCSDQTVYTLVPGTESATKTVNFTAGTGSYSTVINGYTVNAGDYAILFSAVPQDTLFGVSLHRAAPESMIGKSGGGIFGNAPDFNTFYQATRGIYTQNYNSVALKIETLPPVPEPKDYAMWLAGLGFMGLAARKRMGVDNTSGPSAGM